MINEIGTCSNCHQECKPLRCTACKSVSYCSRSCQKVHWKAIHSTTCTREFSKQSNVNTKKNKKSKKSKNKFVEDGNDHVLAAARELNAILSHMSIEEMKEHFDKSMDQIAVEQLLVEKKKRNESRTNHNDERDKNDKLTTSKPYSTNPNEKSTINISQKLKAMERTSAISQDSQCKYNKNNHIKSSSPNKCDVAIEKLIFTCSYNITLLIPSSLSSVLQSWTTATTTNYKIKIQNVHSSTMSVQNDNNEINNHYHNTVKSNVKIFVPNNRKNENNSIMIPVASINLPDRIISTENDALSSVTIYQNDYRNKNDKNLTDNINKKKENTFFFMFRLQYEQDENETLDIINIDTNNYYYSSLQLTNVNALNNVQCRFCNQYLRIPVATNSATTTAAAAATDIRNVCQLPNGYWDEITDYLTCYEGLASINFASTGNKVERGIVFEDESFIVMNKEDLPNVCILAIEGYGEKDQLETNFETSNDHKSMHNNILPNVDVGKSALFRGKRTWSDSVGGATICCNQCCSILGYASFEEPDSCRLLKHRLCAKATDNTFDDKDIEDDLDHNTENVMLNPTRDYFMYNTSATFIARELTRYAESQAVFIFVIFNNDISEKILLLKLLSWNSYMKFSINEDSPRKYYSPQQLSRVTKVIYEEIDNRNHTLVSSEKDKMNPMSFIWGGVDLCCPTSNDLSDEKISTPHDNNMYIFNGKTESKACVHMHIPGDEWIKVRDALVVGNEFIPDELSRVTVLLKLGNDARKDNAVLSVLPLSY